MRGYRKIIAVVVAAIGLATGSTVFATKAEAKPHFSVVLGFGGPAYAGPYYAAPPAYYAPPPVYVAPAPAYYYPAPVYYPPRPAYYAPRPVYARPPYDDDED